MISFQKWEIWIIVRLTTKIPTEMNRGKIGPLIAWRFHPRDRNGAATQYVRPAIKRRCKALCELQNAPPTELPTINNMPINAIYIILRVEVGNFCSISK